MNLPKLKKDTKIGLLSPSAPITYDAPYAAETAEKFLISAGYEIVKGSLFGKIDSSYRSGTIYERVSELNDMIHNDEIDCIMMVAGGFVSVSMLPYIDYEYLKQHPKIIVGHSDVTSLLLAIYEKCGFPTFYGPNFVTSFAHNEFYQKYSLDCFENVINNSDRFTLEMPEYYNDENFDYYLANDSFDKMRSNEPKKKNNWNVVKDGIAEGRLIGGNTDNFSLLYGSPYCPDIRQRDILFIENVNEEADFFERIISTLHLYGVFDKISGLIIEKAKGYDEIGSGKEEIDIFSEIVKNPEFPIIIDVDCGHTTPIMTLPIGETVRLDTYEKAITIFKDRNH